MPETPRTYDVKQYVYDQRGERNEKPGSERTFLMLPHPKAIGFSQGIDEVNEKEPTALLSNYPPLTAFVGMSRNHSGLIVSGQNMNRMLSFPIVLFAFVLSSFGCAKPISHAASPASLPMEAAVDAKPNVTASASFAGSWESCAGAESPGQCSRYLLLQRGKRICGTWSYFASGDSYEGRVMAEAISPVEARRTRICGRPGSETRTECEAGWDTIDRPLRLCGGKLGDLDDKDGRCFADFERVGRPAPSLADLAGQAWVKACLSRKEARSK
jgi:hypothetical protein